MSNSLVSSSSPLTASSSPSETKDGMLAVLPRLDQRDPFNAAHWVDGWTPGAQWCRARVGLSGLPDDEAKYEKFGLQGPMRLAQRLGSDADNGDEDMYGGDGAGLFKRAPGFWVSVGLTEPCDQTISTCYEHARLFMDPFPWEMAARLRGLATQGRAEERQEWARKWELQAAQMLLKTHPPESHMACVAQRVLKTSVFGSMRHAYDLPESIGWGVLDLWADAPLFFPRPYAPCGERVEGEPELGESTQDDIDASEDELMFFKLTPEEQERTHEVARLFAKAFFEVLRQDPAFCALHECPIGHENMDDRPRWGDSWPPSCMTDATAVEVAASFATAHIERQKIDESLAEGTSSRAVEEGIERQAAKSNPDETHPQATSIRKKGPFRI